MSVEIRTDEPLGEDEAPRSIVLSMARGGLCRCPRCGEGKLFSGYLTVAPDCDACGEDFSGEEAHDLPPYVTVFVVGHVVVALLMIAEANTDWSLATHLVVWTLVTIAMCFAMMKPVKGAVVGLQWALRMAGFDKKD